MNYSFTRIRGRMVVALVVATLLVGAGAYAQQGAPGLIAPIPGVPTQNQLDILRGQVETLTRTVQLQQQEIDRQANAHEELGGQLDRVQMDVRRLPPVGRVIRADFESDEVGENEPIPVPYDEDVYYDKPVYGDCDNDCMSIDIGAQYRLIFNAANFDFHDATISDSQDTQNFFNQRFRTWLLFRPNERVEGYIQAEMGHILWNENLDFPHTYGADRVGVELRRGYLTYYDDSCGRWRAGIQDWHDAFGESYTLGTDDALDDYDSFGAVLANSIWDFNVGGLSYTRQFAGMGDMNLNAGAFVLMEGDVRAADDAYLLALDLDWPHSDESSVGFSVYYLNDNGDYSHPTAAPYDNAWDVWLGVRGKTKLASIPLQAFVIYNGGGRNELGAVPDVTHDNVALKLALGAVPLPYGGVSFQTLYSDAGFRTIAQSARDNFGAQGYWSYLILTSPHGPSDVNDLGVSLQNRGLGLLTVQAKYDYPLHERLTGTFAAGWLKSAKANPTSGSSDMGTELVKMFTLDLSGGLTVDLGAAVFFTGNFYKPAPAAPRPDTLWEAFTRVQLEF